MSFFTPQDDLDLPVKVVKGYLGKDLFDIFSIELSDTNQNQEKDLYVFIFNCGSYMIMQIYVL